MKKLKEMPKPMTFDQWLESENRIPSDRLRIDLRAAWAAGQARTNAAEQRAEKAESESTYFCNLNAQKNERIAELEAAQNEIGAKAIERIADEITKAMDELGMIDRVLYARSIQFMRNVASIIRREAKRMRDSKAPGDSVNTQDVNIGWLQRATPGDPE